MEHKIVFLSYNSVVKIMWVEVVKTALGLTDDQVATALKNSEIQE